MKHPSPSADVAGTIPGLDAAPALKDAAGRNKLAKPLLKAAMSVGLVWWFVRGTDFQAVGQAVGRTHLGLVLLGVAAAFAIHLARAARWRLLLREYGSEASLGFLFRSCLVGRFFSNLLPSTIGGDVYRAYDGCRLGQSLARSVSIIMVDRFLGLLVLMAFALAALGVESRLTAALPQLPAWVAAGALGLTAVVGAIFFPPAWLPGLFADTRLRIGRKLHVVFQALFELRGRRRVLVKALGWSLLLQVLDVILGYLFAAALDIPIGLQSFFLIIPLATIVMMLPVAINGIGLREGAYIFIFAVHGVPRPDALAYVLLGYALMVLQGLVGGTVYALRR